MINVHSNVLHYKGTHYDFGYKQGEQLRQSPILANREKQWFSRRKYNFIIDVHTFNNLIHTFAPGMWEEIQGLADALQLEIDTAIQQFGGYYLEFMRSGCSIVTGDDYFVRNYDNHPHSYDGRYIIYTPTDTGFATIGPSMQITGRTDGMNEKGLVMGYNFINRRQSEDGFLCNMIGRILLETCANVTEAIDLLKEIPHRHSFSYILLDPAGVTKIVEASPRSVQVREANICTNHFEMLTEENRYRTDDSQRRYQTISQKQHTIVNGSDAFRLLNDPEAGIFAEKYGASSGTIHTSVYYPKEAKVGFALGGNRQPFLFDLNKGQHRHTFTTKQIKGKLNTHYPFANMDLL